MKQTTGSDGNYRWATPARKASILREAVTSSEELPLEFTRPGFFGSASEKALLRARKAN
jgi:hypothetical protein